MFTTINGVNRNHIARLNANGTLDSTFAINVSDWVYATALQPDGKIVVGGMFSAVEGVERANIARLSTGDAALQSLSVSADGASVTWSRGGAAPEVDWVTFERSTDLSTWTLLGSGSRVDGGWQLGGLALSGGQNVSIRARGLARGGYHNGSSSLIESVRLIYLLSAPVVSAATEVTLSGFTAHWWALGGATGYRIDLATDSGFTNLVPGHAGRDLGNVTATVITGLESGRHYYYRVRAYDTLGTGGASSAMEVQTLPSYHAITLKVAGAGIVRSDPVGINVNTDVTHDFANGIEVTLQAHPSAFNLFAGWSGDCTGTGDCDLIMTAARLVTASFVRDMEHSTFIDRDGGIYRPTIQQAYDASVGNDLIRIWGTDFTEHVTCDVDKQISLGGGYNQGYSAKIGTTSLHGTFTIVRGAVVIDGVEISP
jgi:hypothetical protein